MKTHIEYQTIDYQGNPAFVLVPWDDFNRIRLLLDGDKIRSTGIPQAGSIRNWLRKGISANGH